MSRDKFLLQGFDIKAAQILSQLFNAKAGEYPRLSTEAEILFENAAGTQMHFKAHSPYEAAQVLRHIINSDGRGIYNRENADGMVHPVSFRMHKHIRLKPDNREYLLLAFNLRYQDITRAGHLWISDPQMTSYYWMGEERVADKPPMTFDAPRLHDLVCVLEKAGDSWGNVAFTNDKPSPRVSHLKVVK